MMTDGVCLPNLDRNLPHRAARSHLRMLRALTSGEPIMGSGKDVGGERTSWLRDRQTPVASCG